MESLLRLTGIRGAEEAPPAPQLAVLDFFFPGFSSISTIVSKYLGIDLNLYIPLVILFGGATFAWQYFSDYVWGLVERYLMSTVEVRVDDEIYNIIMAWVSAQKFARSSRRFVVNTNLNSRYWWLWRWDDEEDSDEVDSHESSVEKQKKALSYTPSFGSHTFWYRGRLLLFNRSQNREQGSFMAVSEREEISISCFGRSPWILKELLLEARLAYMKKDAQKTLIYRGTTKSGSTDPTWQRSMSRVSRPLSTVILNEKVKQDLVADVTDYLSPSTRRWYSGRGIPYRRGYLLYGPPGTGKSSLSLALAGHFGMKIYIVSLSSVTATEESLATLFSELPRRCVVLLEDIDTAGLTHTREEAKPATGENTSDSVPGQVTPGNGAGIPGRLSLSGLLNILDGVASQEGRVLIMTTNHLEKLDKALIRPGRVDMIVNFGLADDEMSATIFRAIFATMEGDNPVVETSIEVDDEAVVAAKKKEKEEADLKVERLAAQFAAKIPAHEFSPAEIQGFLLKNKREPETAVETAEAWVVEMRKEKKEKELKDAEEKRLAEKKKKEEEAEKKAEEEKKKAEEEKAKAEEEKKKAKEEAKKKKRETKRSGKARKASRGKKEDKEARDASDSSSDSQGDSDSEAGATDTSISEPDLQPAKAEAKKSPVIGGEKTSVECGISTTC